MKEKNHLWGRGNHRQAEFWFLENFKNFLPRFMWEQGSGKIRRIETHGQYPRSVQHSPQVLPVSQSLWTKNPRPGTTLKLLIWVTQRNHRNNHIETTALRTTPRQLRGMAGQWLWRWEETLILLPEWTNHLLSSLRYIFSLSPSSSHIRQFPTPRIPDVPVCRLSPKSWSDFSTDMVWNLKI